MPADDRLAMIDGLIIIFYYHNDHLGTPLAMTDARRERCVEGSL